MLDSDIAAVDLQAGLIDPPPRWVRTVLAAKWYGVAPWEMMAQEDDAFWTEAGMLMRSIEAEAHERASKKKP